MRTRVFWTDAAERAVKTFAQSLLATLAVATGLLDASWLDSLSVAGLATLLSLLTSVASAGAGSAGSASLVDSAGRHARPE
ncbi:hypothetical protein GCM10027047_01760 [Rhodococcus aerolatus]